MLRKLRATYCDRGWGIRIPLCVTIHMRPDEDGIIDHARL